MNKDMEIKYLISACAKYVLEPESNANITLIALDLLLAMGSVMAQYASVFLALVSAYQLSTLGESGIRAHQYP